MAQRRRTQFPAWVVILILSALIITTFSVLLVMGTLNLIPEPPYTPEDPFTLYILTAFNLVAFSVFSFILARLLLRIRRERRAHRLGSRLKSRLVWYFIVISILPLIGLGLFSYLFISVTIDKWFGEHHRAVLRDSQYISEQYMEHEKRDFAQMTRMLRRLIEISPGLEAREGARSFLPEITHNPKLQLLQVISGSGHILFAYEKPGAALDDLQSDLARARTEILAGQEFTRPIPDQSEERFSVSAIPFQTRPGGLLAIYQSPPELAERADNIAHQHELYEGLYRKQGHIQRTTFQVLGLITFLLLFAATWTAMHLSKGITTPIQALAEVTQKVAQGDFDQTVDCLAEDELAILVDSFNRMTAQLRENRGQLEASAARLRETNLTLQERHRYIETVLESLSTGIISVDSKDRITTINRAAIRILDLKDTPPDHMTMVEALSPVLSAENVNTITSLIRRAKRTGFATGDIQLENPKGASHLVISASALRDESGQLQDIVIMLEDITELVRAQRQAVWSEVAMRMAHEIKNPLTPIQLSVERIARNAERYGAALVDERYKQVIAECTATILGEVHTLQRMVNEFTRFARLPQAKLEEASLNHIISSTIKLYDDRLNGIVIEPKLSPALPAMKLDPEQIKRALVNLIDNAIEAVDQVSGERRITIATRYLSRQELAQLVVSDTGIGIDPKDYPKLFTPYFSKRTHGTGLGLAIVSHIVAEHHGNVRAEPNAPRGARFTIELPINQSLRLKVAG